MREHLRAAATVVPIVASLVLGTAWQASAQTPGPPATSPIEGLLNQILAPSTVPSRPVAPPPTAAPATAPARPAAATGAATTTTTAAPAARVVPPEFIPIINSIRRSGGRTTAPLLDALQPLLDLGMAPQETAMTGFGHFPVAGEASWRDDWYEPRFGPPFHLHKGTDIFAARGTPVRAPFAGVVRLEDSGLGGKGVFLTVPDGTFYYMAHLDAFARGMPSGASVKQGQLVGYVGDSGNAAGGSPHVHFEIHPRGGDAVNPKPILDGWLADAISGAASLLAANNVGVPRALTSAGALRRFQDESPLSGPTVGPLLWASSLSAGGGSIRLAEIQFARIASRGDWEKHSGAAQARADAVRKGRDMAWSLLGPLTPVGLAPVLRSGS